MHSESKNKRTVKGSLLAGQTDSSSLTNSRPSLTNPPTRPDSLVFSQHSSTVRTLGNIKLKAEDLRQLLTCVLDSSERLRLIGLQTQSQITLSEAVLLRDLCSSTWIRLLSRSL